MRGKSQLGIAIAGILGTAGFARPAAFAQDANPTAAPSAGEEIDEVVVTGFRASLQSSTNAKRESVGFADSIFAEDIGNFQDTNLAESLNRIPGITITRETYGEVVDRAANALLEKEHRKAK